jgi:hypothetical protein
MSKNQLSLIAGLAGMALGMAHATSALYPQVVWEPPHPLPKKGYRPHRPKGTHKANARKSSKR